MVGQKGFPTLGDMKKTIPPGGLLNPGLRGGVSVGGGKALPLSSPKRKKRKKGK